MTTESPPRPKPTTLAQRHPAYARCLCGHLKLMHGTCGCEGIFTALDEQGGFGESGACSCHGFVGADPIPGSALKAALL